MTEWRAVPGWPQYEVYSAGEIWGPNGKVGKWFSDQGYELVRLSGPRQVERVHRLVAKAFCPNPHGKPCVNHIDHNRANNSAANLEWCTQAENLAHADKAGRMRRDFWAGRRSPNAKLSDRQVIEIRVKYAIGVETFQSLAKSFGLSKRAIGRIVNRETDADVQPLPDPPKEQAA